jgi:hypothetical protein
MIFVILEFLILHRYFKHVLLPANALDKLPTIFGSFKDIQIKNLISNSQIYKDWKEVHWNECGLSQPSLAPFN